MKEVKAKKVLVLLVGLFLTGTVFSQKMQPYGKWKYLWDRTGWFTELNGGLRLLGQGSDQATINPGYTINGALGYMFNEKLGVRGRIDFISFSTNNSAPLSFDHSKSLGLAIEGMYNVLPLFTKKTSQKFRFYFHGGIGATSHFNKELKDYREANSIESLDPYIKGNDDYGHVILGITPQFHLNSRVSANFDVSSQLHLKQDWSYFGYGSQKSGLGSVLLISAGLTLRL